MGLLSGQMKGQGTVFCSTNEETNTEWTGALSNLIQKDDQHGFITLAAGTGISYGYMGLCMHCVIPGKVKLGIHGGAGYFPFREGDFLYSGGIKIFLIKSFYLDLIYSKYRRWYEGYDEDGPSYEFVETGSYPRHGPALLAGFAWFFSKDLGLNIAFGVGYNVNKYKEFIAKSDMGFVYRF